MTGTSGNAEIGAMADWLRQREGETDAAWISRLQETFRPNQDEGLSDARRATLDRMGERLMMRFLAAREADRQDK